MSIIQRTRSLMDNALSPARPFNLFNPLQIHKFHYRFVQFLLDSSYQRAHIKEEGFVFRFEYLYLILFIFGYGELLHVIFITTYFKPIPGEPYWDPIVNLFLGKKGIFDTFFSFNLLVVEMTALYGLKQVFWLPFCDLYTGKFIYQLMVANIDSYWIASVPSMPKPVKLRDLPSLWRAVRYFDFSQDQFDYRKFSFYSLTHVPSISTKLRLKLVWLQLIAEKLSVWGALIVYSLTIAVFIAFIILMTRDYPSTIVFWCWTLPIIIIFLFYTSLKIILIMRIWLMVPWLLILVAYLYVSHCTQLNRKLKSLSSSDPKTKPRPRQAMLWLRHFLREHTLSCASILRLDHEFLAGTIFCFLVILLPTNVFLLNRVLFKRLALLERISSLMVILAQTGNSASLFVPMALVSSRLHACLPRLMGVQGMLGFKSLSYKLKVDTVMQRVNASPKYGVTVGPGPVITYYSILNIVSFYLAFFIYVLNSRF